MGFVTTTEQTQTTAAPAGDNQAAIIEHTVAKANAIWLAPALVLAAVAVFGFFTLLNYPVTGVDEPWLANRAWALLQTGHAFGSVESGIFQRYDGYWIYWFYLLSLIPAGFIWLFGLSLSSVRLVSLVFGLLLLAVVYVIARKLYGRRAAVIAMALLATSAPFVLSSHMARPDIIVTALGFGAIALYLTDSKSSLTIKSLLSGLAIGLALDIHPNVLVFGPVMLTLFWLDYGKSILRTGRFRGFALGGTVGVLYFICIHILPNSQTYFALARISDGFSHTPPALEVNLGLWRSSLLGTIDYLDLLILPVLIPALIFLIRRQSRSDVRVIALFGISILVMAAAIREKSPFYAILIAPTVPLMVAPYVDNITKKVGTIGQWAFWRNVIVGSVLVTTAYINLSPAMHGSDADYQKVLGYLGRTIPAGSLVYGAPTYWFALQDTHYINWEQLVFQQKVTPGSSFSDVVKAIKPDYMVVDLYMDDFTMDDDVCHAKLDEMPCVPKTELSTLLSRDATLAGEIKTDDFGDIRVYKMNWANTQSGARR